MLKKVFELCVAMILLSSLACTSDNSSSDTSSCSNTADNNNPINLQVDGAYAATGRAGETEVFYFDARKGVNYSFYSWQTDGMSCPFSIYSEDFYHVFFSDQSYGDNAGAGSESDAKVIPFQGSKKLNFTSIGTERIYIVAPVWVGGGDGYHYPSFNYFWVKENRVIYFFGLQQKVRFGQELSFYGLDKFNLLIDSVDSKTVKFYYQYKIDEMGEIIYDKGDFCAGGYAGIVNEGETHFDRLDWLGDNYTKYDGLIIKVESIVDYEISSIFIFYRGQKLLFDENNEWQSFSLGVGDTFEYPYGAFQLLSVTNNSSGKITSTKFENGKPITRSGLTEIQNGHPIVDDLLNNIEFNAIQIQENGIEFDARLK